MDISRLADLLKNKASSALEDYSQLADAYPNLKNFAGALVGNVERNVPTQADFQSPQAMSQWSQSAALNAPMGLVNKAVNNPLTDIENYWNELGAKGSLGENKGVITLEKIEVPHKNRNAGIGSKAMQSLIDYADETGKTIKLGASSQLGGDKSRLIDFYKRFGFEIDKKTAPVSAMWKDTSMTRTPQQIGGALNLAGLMQTSAFPFAPSGAGTLGSIKNLNANLLSKYLKEGRLSPEEMAKYEKNALKMETPALQKFNVENANLQGGTPESRAGALGFDVSGVHKTEHPDIKNFLNKYLGKNTIGNAASKQLEQTSKLGHWFSNSGLPDNMPGNISYPVIIKMENPMELSSTGALIAQLEEKGLKGFKKYIKDSDSDSLIINKDTETKGSSYIVPNPNNIRSRFAAFDPLRAASPSLLAGGALGSLLLNEEMNKGK